MTPAGKPPVSILMYHQVGTFPAPRAHRALYCHVGRFAAQMAYLRRFGYTVISLAQAVDGLFGGAPLPRRPVVLTFDDGYRNFRDHAWPILRRHGFPATLFMVAGKVAGRADWLSDNQEAAPLLDAAELRALHAEGLDIGSHTLSHPRLSRLPAAEVEREVGESKRRLEALLGAPVPHFCYPSGDYDAAVRETVRAAGYRAALTCIRGAANHAANPFEIPRKAISYGDNLVGFFWKLHMKHLPKERRR